MASASAAVVVAPAAAKRSRVEDVDTDNVRGDGHGDPRERERERCTKRHKATMEACFQVRNLYLAQRDGKTLPLDELVAAGKELHELYEAFGDKADETWMENFTYDVYELVECVGDVLDCVCGVLKKSRRLPAGAAEVVARLEDVEKAADKCTAYLP